MTASPPARFRIRGLVQTVRYASARLSKDEPGPLDNGRGGRGALPRLALIGAVVLLVAQALASASHAALTVTSVAETEKTDLGFKGTAPANAQVTIIVENNKLVGGTSTYMTKADAKGNWEFKPPKEDRSSFKDKGQVTATAKGCPNATTTLAAAFTPGQNSVVTTSTVLPGSTATAGAATFALAGHFTALDTSVDYNSASPTFGKLSSTLLASQFHLTGTGSAGTLDLALDKDQPFSVSLLSAWQSPTLSGNTISFADLPFSGTATLNSTSSSFTGKADGSVTFLENDQESTTFNFTMTTGFGDVSGTVFAQGASELASLPEPSSAVLIAVGATAAAALAACRRAARLWRT